jgi:uncharacterized SAM-binding protein YcdF (DUF218 family)
MFYYASKILWFFATPSNLLIVLIVMGALLATTRRFRRAGASLALIVGLGTIVAGLSPISSYLMLPLENRFPAFRDDGRPVTGIILLGGSVEAEKSLSRHMLIANEAAERVLGTIALAHLYPRARILISSGSGSLLQNAPAEAPVIADYFKAIGIDPARVMIEDRSRTTFENAVFSRALADPKPGERWLLVTSAWHMPRSVGVFRKAGFDVTAYPVDYRTGSTLWDQEIFASMSEGLRRLDVGAKEWTGLVAYHFAGLTSALLPAPQDSPTVSR